MYVCLFVLLFVRRFGGTLLSLHFFHITIQVWHGRKITHTHTHTQTHAHTHTQTHTRTHVWHDITGVCAGGIFFVERDKERESE